MPMDGNAPEATPAEAIDDEAVETAIAEHPHEAAEALAAIRLGRETQLPSLDGLDAAAKALNRPLEAFWVEQIKAANYLPMFIAALRGKGVPVSAWKLDHDETQWKDKELGAFLARISAFRCRVLANGAPKGSGVLVGPSSVLTAWHVIAVAKPGDPQEPVPRVEVELADGRRIEAGMPPRTQSPCGDDEFPNPPNPGRQPRSDSDVQDRNDVALLRLKEPAGIHLGFATIAAPPYDYGGPAAMLLIHYPEGEYQGVEFGTFRKLRSLKARWGYDLQGTRGGSSGGGCFDTRYRLVGIHQGRALESHGRLVPAIRFIADVRDAIAEDQTPEKIWSLDGTADGTLVVGRDRFFTAYHEASRGPPRVRGIWVRRTDLKHDLSGLPFSYDMLARLVARNPEVRLVRVSFDALVSNLPDEVARRAAEAGVSVTAPAPAAGVGLDQTEPEAVVADRSRTLALALDREARRMGVRLWIFFEHPAVVFGDEPRWALTAFVDQALRLDSLRIALAGYEAVQMPGDQFETAFDAQGPGAPGLMVEYLTGFSQVDVANLIRAAAEDLGRKVSPERVAEWTAEALKDLTEVNGQYDSAIRAEIGSRLQPRLRQLRDEVGP